MVRNLESQDDFYLVKCADLDCMVLADSFENAVCYGLKKILKEKGSETNLSFIIGVDLVKNYDFETRIFKTADILNDLGHFKLAENLACLSDFFLDKGENPH